MNARLRPGRARWLARWLVAGVAAVSTLGVLVWTGVVHANNPPTARYPVRGVDVSRYQGIIDWPVLSRQGIQFAFVKATEGATSVDERFAANLADARRSGVRVGAYHFFSFESPGADQAANVIRTVPADDDLLPVAIDVEFYGPAWSQPPPVREVRAQLTQLVDTLTEHYGRAPIIYATPESFDRYIAGAFPGCDIWIRDIWREPVLTDGRSWTFWQFSDRQHLDGYRGEENFIDVNVFAGNALTWQAYGG